MKEASKIIAYLVGVLLLGALLAPPVFWILRGLEPWALANGLMKWDPRESNVLINGPLGFITTDFQKCFARAVPLAAVLLALPAGRQLGITRLRHLGLEDDPRGGMHLLRGFLTAALLAGVLASALVLSNMRPVQTPTPWMQIPMAALGAAFVAIIEQFIFQGVIFGFLLRIGRPLSALWWTTVIFACAHFLRPESAAPIKHVGWLTGFQLLPTLFLGVAQPIALLDQFVPLLALGGLTAYARMRTGGLWLSIGLHAGVLFAAWSLAAVSLPGHSFPPWIGPELMNGLAAAGMLLAALFLVRIRLDHEELLPDRRPRD